MTTNLEPTQPPLRILIVDDNVDAADSLALLVRRLGGHTVDVAYSGEKALQLAKASRPAVILLDLGLPLISGFEISRQLRQMPETAEAVIIAITGHCQPRDREASHAAGIDLHLRKPVEIDELLSYLRAPVASQTTAP